MADFKRRVAGHRMTDVQVEAIRRVDPTSVWRIPDGSYLLVKAAGPGMVQRIQVCEPDEPCGSLAWDFGPRGA